MSPHGSGTQHASRPVVPFTPRTFFASRRVRRPNACCTREGLCSGLPSAGSLGPLPPSAWSASAGCGRSRSLSPRPPPRRPFALEGPPAPPSPVHRNTGRELANLRLLQGSRLCCHGFCASLTGDKFAVKQQRLSGTGRQHGACLAVAVQESESTEDKRILDCNMYKLLVKLRYALELVFLRFRRLSRKGPMRPALQILTRGSLH